MAKLRGIDIRFRTPKPTFWQPALIAIASAAPFVCLLLFPPSLLTTIDAKIFDLLSSGVPRHVPTGRTVIVDIDSSTRYLTAPLIQKLHAAGAAVVALDLMFSAPEADNKQLASALTQSHAVLGFDLSSTRGGRVIANVCTSPLLAQTDPLVCNVPVQPAGAGFLNVYPDPDGITRRAPLLVSDNGVLYPSFALATFLAHAHQPLQSFATHPFTLVRFCKPGRSIPRYSAAQVLSGTLNDHSFAGKIAVVGVSAPSRRSAIATPIGASIPAVELEATAIDNLLAGDYFSLPNRSLIAELSAILLASFIGAGLLSRTSLPIGAALVISLAGVVWIASQTLLLTTHAYFSPFLASFAGLTTLKLYSIRAIFVHRTRARRSQSDLRAANHFITAALGSMIAVRDRETGQHAARIQGYLRSLCNAIAAKPRFRKHLTPQMIELLVELAPIHDIGKIGVPDYILRKPSALTSEEFELMKSHVPMGRQILEEARVQSGLNDEVFFRTATEIVYSHHERWDGTGYPLGLCGDGIPIPGRLLAVADVYDALISKRRYKSEILHADAVEKIRAGAGTHFDPEIVDAFLKVQDDWRTMADTHRDRLDHAASAKIS